jgi:hypothetical protein
MNKWKVSFFVCLGLLVITFLGGAYMLFDQAISYSYLDTSYKDQVKSNAVLGNLIVKGSKSYNQKDFLFLLRQAYPKEFIVEEGNKISMGFNVFEFENNQLVKAQ